MKRKTWIVVANEIEATVYESTRSEEAPKRLKRLLFPQGRLKRSQITSDRAGHAIRTSKGGVPLEGKSDPKRELLKVFARRINALLENGASKNKYDNIILMAEPRFLGVLRKVMCKKCQSKITKEIRKDLSGLSKNEAWKRIADITTIKH